MVVITLTKPPIATSTTVAFLQLLTDNDIGYDKKLFTA